MTVAYLIASHRSPGQVLRLVRRCERIPTPRWWSATTRATRASTTTSPSRARTIPSARRPRSTPVWRRRTGTHFSAWPGSTGFHRLADPRPPRSASDPARRPRGAGLIRHYRRTIVPSESFFATVLMNNPAMGAPNPRRPDERRPRPPPRQRGPLRAQVRHGSRRRRARPSGRAQAACSPALDWIFLAGGAVSPASPDHPIATPQEPWLAETYELP